MVGGISVHAVDVACGEPAAGLRVEVVALGPDGERPLAQGLLGPAGALDHALARGEVPVSAGAHEARFHVGDWLRTRDGSTARVFIEVAVFRFEVLDPAQHLHLPLKFTRWGFAMFRGS